MREAYAIIDLQYGSTGKGLLAGYLARRRRPDTVVSAFGPNAGHTFIDGAGRKFVHIMVPMGALSPECERVLIGPGAVVHPDLLWSEYRALIDAGYRFELLIHENATVVQERHREAEAAYGAHIGSTQKGTGAALAEKITRNLTGGPIVARDVLRNHVLEDHVVSVDDYDHAMDRARILQIEGAQGFSLSCHHGFYPYTTSRDCTIAQLLADCAVPIPHRRDCKNGIEVFGTVRTYPIRVNNKTGSSGPCFPDQEEIKWEALGLQPELTTVTKLPRRVFTFSTVQVMKACRMSAVDAIFLNFCNYGEMEARTIKGIIERQIGVPVKWTGWGPSETDVREGL